VTTSYSEVDLTKSVSARIQRYAAFSAIYWAVGGGVLVAVFTDQPWWAILLWELLALLIVALSVVWLASVAKSAGDALRLYRSGTFAFGVVREGRRYGDGDAAACELTLMLRPAEGLPVQVSHRCDREQCVELADRRGAQVKSLINTLERTWGVWH
jgi:hypothetical protein